MIPAQIQHNPHNQSKQKPEKNPPKQQDSSSVQAPLKPELLSMEEDETGGNEDIGREQTAYLVLGSEERRGWPGR